MSTHGTTGDNSHDRTDSPTRRTLGVDGAGHTHHQRDELVIRVAPDGGLERVVDLDGPYDGRRGDALDDYVHEFVGEQVGWCDRWQATDRDVFGPRQGGL